MLISDIMLAIFFGVVSILTLIIAAKFVYETWFNKPRDPFKEEE